MMIGHKLLMFFAGLNYALFVFFQFSGEDTLANFFICSMLPIFAVGYCFLIKKKTVWVSMFWLFHTVADVFYAFQIIDLIVVPTGFSYYFLSILRIIAYTSLAKHVCENLSLKEILKHHKLSVFILFALNVYMSIALTRVLSPFLKLSWDYVLETAYTVSMLSVLSLASINFFNNNSKKAFYLFVGSICIVVAEVLHVAHSYIFRVSILSLIKVTIIFIGLILIYQQGRLNYKKTKIL